jgi:o-succinylbenzoate synthase
MPPSARSSRSAFFCHEADRGRAGGAAVSLIRARLASYALPFVDVWPAPGGRLAERTGFLLALTDSDGRTGYGDAAPWPRFGVESVGSAGLALRGAMRRLMGLPAEEFRSAIEKLRSLAPVVAAPAARHAIDLALHDLVAQREGVPLAHLLGGPEALAEVTANATIPRTGPERTAALGRAAVESGAGTIKLKVGLAPLEEDVARLDALREAVGPGVRIRVDANQDWSEEEAVRALRAMAAFGLEYAEQPVPAEDLQAMVRVRCETGVPVAADESVRDAASVRRLLEAGAADLLVLKPQVLGGLSAARGVAALAREQGARVVVSSMLESVVGRTGALHFAASLGAGPHAHGIATGGALARDLAPGPEFERGVVRLPAAPGLGVAVEAAELWRDAYEVEAE